MGSVRLLSCVASFLAFVSGLLLLANARPLEEEATSTSRELLNWCPPSGCPTYDPGCNLVPLSDLCYFTPAMLKLNPMPVTAYYCGLGCSSWRAKSPGQYNIISQKDCPAVTCAKTIGQVTAQNGGCASSAGYINAQASGQTKELYYNVDGSWITSQLKGFCLSPSSTSLTAVAGMLAEGFASSLASTYIGGTQHVCGCCNGQETATQTISAFTSASARARVQAFVQAVTVVFGPGSDCDNADVLAQAISTADALAEDLIQIVDSFYNQISLSKFGDKNFYNQVCTSASVPILDHLKVKFANAYACAIVSVLSSASITTTPNPTGTTITDYSSSCSDNYEIAFSTNWVPGTHTAKCANACKCGTSALITNANGCPRGIKVCPGGMCEYMGS